VTDIVQHRKGSSVGNKGDYKHRCKSFYADCNFTALQIRHRGGSHLGGGFAHGRRAVASSHFLRIIVLFFAPAPHAPLYVFRFVSVQLCGAPPCIMHVLC
jgi:hypothetical protein